jgi:hypothetical protein
MERLNDHKLIVEIVKELITKRKKIFDLVTKYTIETEFKELGNTFEISDNQEFTLAHFADSENVNVVLLVEMCHKLDRTIYELVIKNNITESDLN